MGSSASSKSSEDPKPVRKNDANDDEGNVEVIKEKKNIVLDKCNNNHKQTKPRKAVYSMNGAQIHLPDPTNGESEIEISDISPNQQIAEKERQRADIKRKEEEERQNSIIEEGKKNTERKRIQGALKDQINHIKETYEKARLASCDLENASTRVRKHEKSAEYKESPRISNNIYHEKKRELSKHQQEKARLLHILSEIASAKLRHNNANLADLSDPNRASKLAERLSELYDNEWTDVFDAARKKTKSVEVADRDIVESLKNILRFCYKKTRDLSTKQTEFLHKALNKKQTKTPIQMTVHIQTLQKQTVENSKPFFQKAIRQIAEKDLSGDVVVRRIDIQKSPLCNYFNICSELSWYMHIQSPPMELDFEGVDSSTNRFRPYLSTGPELDYVVWPALLLHTDGPLVAKGVAQYKKSSESDAVRERKSNKNTENVSERTKKKGNESEW